MSPKVLPFRKTKVVGLKILNDKVVYYTIVM